MFTKQFITSMPLKKTVFISTFALLSSGGLLYEFPRQEFPSSIKEISAGISKGLSGERALESVRFFTRFWRIGGGEAFDTCVQYVAQNLLDLGFHDGGKSEVVGTYEIYQDYSQEKVWTPKEATLSLESPNRRLLHSFDKTPLMLCPNSFSQDRKAELVYVQGGDKEEQFSAIDVAGKIVLCDAPPSKVFRSAIHRGALGIVSSFVPEFNHAELYPDIISESSVPYDESAKSFGLKISPRTTAELKQLLQQKRVTVRVHINTTFSNSPIKTLVAEIPGCLHPEQRIVLVAHLDHYKPGANDNASGSATLLEIVRTVARAIREKVLPVPSRTLTFLWVDEYRGTQFWMQRNKAALKDVQAAFVMDMLGGDPVKTGGTFRIEKMPDPGVLWTRPPESHSGWGVGRWEKERLFGSYLNDFYLSIVDVHAKETGWKTAVNVWEGGSDHDPFLLNRIPAVLSWHFPDHFYHTSMDDVDKINPSEMRHAGVSVATAALALAYGTEGIAKDVLQEVFRAAETRLTVETETSRQEISSAEAKGEGAYQTSRKHERELLETWEIWYEEGLRSVLSIPVRSPQSDLTSSVENEIQKLRKQLQSSLAALKL